MVPLGCLRTINFPMSPWVEMVPLVLEWILCLPLSPWIEMVPLGCPWTMTLPMSPCIEMVPNPWYESPHTHIISPPHLIHLPFHSFSFFPNKHSLSPSYIFQHIFTLVPTKINSNTRLKTQHYFPLQFISFPFNHHLAPLTFPLTN